MGGEKPGPLNGLWFLFGPGRQRPTAVSARDAGPCSKLAECSGERKVAAGGHCFWWRRSRSLAWSAQPSCGERAVGPVYRPGSGGVSVWAAGQGTQLVGAGARTALRLPAAGLLRGAGPRRRQRVLWGPRRLVTWVGAGRAGTMARAQCLSLRGRSPRWLVGFRDSMEPPSVPPGMRWPVAPGQLVEVRPCRPPGWAFPPLRAAPRGSPWKWPRSVRPPRGRSLCPVLLQLCWLMGTGRGSCANISLPFQRPHHHPFLAGAPGARPLPSSLRGNSTPGPNTGEVFFLLGEPAVPLEDLVLSPVVTVREDVLPRGPILPLPSAQDHAARRRQRGRQRARRDHPEDDRGGGRHHQHPALQQPERGEWGPQAWRLRAALLPWGSGGEFGGGASLPPTPNHPWAGPLERHVAGAQLGGGLGADRD